MLPDATRILVAFAFTSLFNFAYELAFDDCAGNQASKPTDSRFERTLKRIFFCFSITGD